LVEKYVVKSESVSHHEWLDKVLGPRNGKERGWWHKFQDSDNEKTNYYYNRVEILQ